MSVPFSLLFAQATNAATAVATSPDAATYPDRPIWTSFLLYGVVFVLIYFLFFRPQIQASKQKEATVKGAKTGDKIVTSSGIHGVITNVKDTTVIVRVADNVKLEIEKSHIDKVTREAVSTEPEKTVTAKVS